MARAAKGSAEGTCWVVIIAVTFVCLVMGFLLVNLDDMLREDLKVAKAGRLVCDAKAVMTIDCAKPCVPSCKAVMMGVKTMKTIYPKWNVCSTAKDQDACKQDTAGTKAANTALTAALGGALGVTSASQIETAKFIAGDFYGSRCFNADWTALTKQFGVCA